jgi:DNA (cytosine-5)-methyltransferase 1
VVLRILDLYCGMGGLSLGFALALEGAEVLGLDIDRHAVETYNLNLERFGCRAEAADLLEWKPGKKRFDIVIGGPPCQPFSTANTKRTGKRHPLFPTLGRFFELVRMIRPEAFVFENVPGLLRPRFRPVLETHFRSLSRRYRIEYGPLNAADYGVPQTRIRVIAVGVRRDTGREFLFPPPTHLKAGMPRGWLGTREALYDLAGDFSMIVTGKGIRNNLAVFRCPNSPSYTITTKSSGDTAIYLVWSGSQHVRKLTVRERMRLQSFPEWWQFPEHVSMTKRYKLVGEAVPPILAYRVAVALGRALGLRTREPPREEEWDLPYFRRAFADYFDRADGNG